MTEDMNAPAVPNSIPDDDPKRHLVVAKPDTDETLEHISIAGGTYTILVSGEQTAGRYCLIDMYVPLKGGPPPHRHDFEEMFSVLQGEIEVTFRGEKYVAHAGETVNVPANAPHSFVNLSDGPARLLCMCTPAGQDEYFAEIGDRVATRTAPPPELSEEERTGRRQKALALATKYRSEFLR